MADVFSVAKRSEVMSRIRSRGNRATELALARLLRQMEIRGWRRHYEIRISNPESEGFRVKPDFVFLKGRIALFVDGCFWHACPRHMTRPSTNAAFWNEKLEANRVRDQTVNRTLRRAGWRVLRIWEHDLTGRSDTRLIARLRKFLVE
jgi:DNA mismatch endonuclease (patch repair protein)